MLGEYLSKKWKRRPKQPTVAAELIHCKEEGLVSTTALVVPLKDDTDENVVRLRKNAL